MALYRRRVLALGVMATTGGCLGIKGSTDAQSSTEPTGEDAHVENGVLDYAGFVDGAAEVLDEDGRTVVAYGDPERRFGFSAGYRGEVADDDEMEVSTDLSGGTPTAFPAPVFDPDRERFVFHVFVNESFVEFAEWTAVVGRPDDPERTSDLAFEAATDDVSRTIVDPRGTLPLAIVDLETEPNGVAVSAADADTAAGRRSVPQVVFEFEYDADAETVAITHAGGDDLRRDQVSITVGTRSADATFDSETVAAGSTMTVDVSELDAEESMRVIWTDREEGHSATLAEWTLSGE